MKNTLICLLILVLVFGGGGGYFFFKEQQEEKRIAEIKKGWYVEITDEYINVRDQASTNGKELGKANKGEVYKVLEMDFSNISYYWYKIDYNGTNAWVASKRKDPFLKDHNNPTDIADPVIKYYEDVYYVANINEINYKHLEVVEDKEEYEITHVVYHEYKPSEHKDQYWILYTVTDAVGKSSSKLQKIVFEERPSEDEVLDFSEYRNY